MNTPFFISPRVIEVINSLPETDRIALASAIAGELLLGGNAEASLTPLQNLAYRIIRDNVRRDTSRVMSAGTFASTESTSYMGARG